MKESVSDYIEKKLNLKVNREKTQAVYITKMKFLGFSFYQKKKDVGIRVHPKTLRKLKAKVKHRTGRSDGKGEVERIHKLNNMLRGWVNYYRIADMAGILKEVDAWMRSRIRMWYWKQWRKIKTRFKNLMKLGVPRAKAWEYANTRKGYWRISSSPILHTTLSDKVLKEKGYLSFLGQYNQTRKAI